MGFGKVSCEMLGGGCLGLQVANRFGRASALRFRGVAARGNRGWRMRRRDWRRSGRPSLSGDSGSDRGHGVFDIGQVGNVVFDF